MKKKHIIFDLDGTLSDTAKATAAAISRVEKQYELPKISISHIHAAMGLADLEFYAHLYPNESAEKLMKAGAAIDSLEEEAIKAIGKEILFPGVMDMLTGLVNNGYNLYIASTGSENHVYTTLISAGIEKLFTAISCGEPAKILMVKNIIAGRDPQKWVMVGDMFKDSEAARNNNILALGAGFGYLAEEDRRLFDGALSEPGEIYDYLKE